MIKVERRELTEEEALLKGEIQYLGPSEYKKIRQNGRGIVVLFLPIKMQEAGTELRLAKNMVVQPGDDNGTIEMVRVVITKVLGNNKYEVSEIGTA